MSDAASDSGHPPDDSRLEAFLARNPGCDGLRSLARRPEFGTTWDAAALCRAGRSRLGSDPSRSFALGFLARRLARGSTAAFARSRALQAQSASRLGAHACAHRHFRAAIDGLEPNGDLEEVASLSLASAYSLTSLGKYAQAKRAIEHALAFFARLERPAEQARAHFELGALAYRQDRYREALHHFRDCLRFADVFPALYDHASLFGNIANCLVALGRYRAADRNFERARAIARRLGLELAVPYIEGNWAYGLGLQGLFSSALELYDRALELARTHKNNDLVGGILVDLAELLLQIGMTRDARLRAGAALDVLPPNQLDKERAQARLHIAIAWLLEGRLDEARDASEGALRQFEFESNDVWAARCHLLLARVAWQRAHLEEALDRALRARAVFEQFGRGVRAAGAELLIAEVETARGDPVSALRRLLILRRRLAGLLTPWVDVELHRSTARALSALGRPDEARRHFASALELLETHRGRVPADDFMVAFLQSQAALHAEAVENLLELGNSAAAFEVVERARSRALVDLLGARGGVGRAGATDWLRDVRLKRLRDALSATISRLHELTVDGELASESDLEALQERRRELEAAIAERVRDAQIQDHSFRTLRTVRAPSIESVRATLDEHTVLVEYFLTPREVHAFVLSRSGLVHRRLDVAASEVERRVQKFRFHVSHVVTALEPDDPLMELRNRSAAANLRALATQLFDPLRPDLAGRQLVIVPHGALHNVPFHAFPSCDGGWVVDEFEITYAPSAAVYVHGIHRDASDARGLALFAISDRLAPAIDVEADAVEASGPPPVRAWRGADATWTRLREEVGHARVVHIASHARLNRELPMLSAIRFADRWADLYDVYDLDVRAELVVVSACESGASHITAGDELLGLMRGWLFAGARRLLLAQWRLDDKAAALFMHTFYEGVGAGRSHHAALRTAMTRVRERFPHPYHWAPFFFVGQAGPRVRPRSF